MGVVTDGLGVVAANMTGSSFPYKIAIGGSELTFASGQSTLGSELNRNLITTKDLFSNEVTFISNFSAAEISGLTVREFGTFTSGNTMLDRQLMNGSLVFEGEQELQVQETFGFFISG